ncbi:hypothetical protein T440DRAFT_195570 [Plenodomus tracheiphilus IPT5]|uniref:Uncharacterized protein n=1 Tax=Plenodomus tracheiphilus IPT5 TaxID=1408161 RepID=A0A6A7AZ63_9PLEO|nr:hypothetical protein T440DRAFT_195570 [Plenodomus tracheiphilus IPT5]
MAALLAVGIGLGAEKLGREISEKRLERKEKKTIAEHEAFYGTTGTSSSSSPYTTRERQSQTERKREQARRELQAARQGDDNVPQYASRRGSVSEDRASEDAPPPRYEDVVQQDVRRGA